MFKRCAQFLCFNVLIITGCADQHGSATSQRGTMVTSPSTSSQRTAAYYADSLAQARFDVTLLYFIDHLIDHTNLRQDTSWKVPPDGDIDLEDEFIMRPKWGDNPDSVEFPFNDLHMSYHAGPQRDYFLVNGWKIPETVYTGGNRFPESSIHRFQYQSGAYLVFNGVLSDFNGYGGRVHFDYFFDLTEARPTADMYKNCWGFVYEPFFYGELNEDTYLDRIKVDGICRPSDLEFDTITIEAQTYRNRRWQPLRDSIKMPYTIKLLLNEDKKIIRLGAINWMRPVSLN